MKTLLRLCAPLAVLAMLIVPLMAQNVVPGTTVTTTGPVTADTTISVGTLAGQVLMWLAAAFSVPVGTLLSMWLFKLAQRLGVETTMQQREKLQSILVNGLNAAAAKNAERFQGMGKLEIKNAIVAEAIGYAQTHGAETIKALGLDPLSGSAVEVLKARIETAIADPTTPTPAAISGVMPVQADIPVRRK